MSKAYLHFSFIVCSLLFALVLAIFPWPPAFQDFRPEIVCLVVLYWVYVLPTFLGVFFAFLVGLLQSVVESGLWGSHALGLAFAVYLLAYFRYRVNNAALWEQSLLVGMFVLVHQILVSWMNYFVGYPIDLQLLFCTSLSSALFWPLLRFCFDRIRRSYLIAH